MITSIRTHFAYCSSGIQINPILQPGGTNIMRNKTEIVNTLCKYITHQQKLPKRDLKMSSSFDFITDADNGVLSTDVCNTTLGQTLTTNETNNVIASLNENIKQQTIPKSETNWGLSSPSPISPLPSILENNVISLATPHNKIEKLDQTNLKLEPIIDSNEDQDVIPFNQLSNRIKFEKNTSGSISQYLEIKNEKTKN